ncbi:hypothetical protein [Bartonella sp. W8122]|nr:hypothetical protein [Bartonella sp. W8122]
MPEENRPLDEPKDFYKSTQLPTGKGRRQQARGHFSLKQSNDV